MKAFLVLLARNRLALVGGIVMCAVVLLALITPLLEQPGRIPPTASCGPSPTARGWVPTIWAAISCHG